VAAHDLVCISRAAGAAGEEVGRLVAERLGVRYVDEEIILQAAAKAGLDPETVADEERRKPLFTGLLGYLAAGADPTIIPLDTESVPSESVRALIRDAIEEVGAAGGAVIVAHAASYALGGHEPRPLRVLITAPPGVRAARIAAADGLGEREAAKAVGRSDADRADYLKRFYGVSQELPVHYDLVVNTEALSIDRAAALIEAALADRAILSDRPV
jgi:cytidylate kinase